MMVAVYFVVGLFVKWYREVRAKVLGIFQASPEKTAQFAHAGVGASLVFILTLLFLPLWAAAELVLLFAFLKEYIEYRWGVWEPKDSWRGSARDFVFWALGVLIAGVVLAVR